MQVANDHSLDHITAILAQQSPTPKKALLQSQWKANAMRIITKIKPREPKRMVD